MPEVLPATIAKEETQAILPSTKKSNLRANTVYPNHAVVCTGGPALFDARNHAPNWLKPLNTTRYHVLYVYYIYIFLRKPGTGYVSDSIILVHICALIILMTLYRCQGTTTTAQKQIVCHSMVLCRAHHITIPLGKIQTRGGRAHYIPLPLGKLHRHVVPGTWYAI